MANSVKGGQLTTYNPNLPYTTSTTAGTSGVIVYAVSAAGVQGGVTNPAAAGGTGSTANIFYAGITHFNNIAGNNGIYAGPAGAEIPMIDKQESVVATCTVSNSYMGSDSIPMYHVRLLDPGSSCSCSCYG